MHSRQEFQVSNQLRQLAEKMQIPISVTIELTHQCNLTCAHCYNFDRGDRGKLRVLKNEAQQELSREEVLNLIDDLAEAQTLYVSFTGGEPTVHPHLLEFIQRARHHKMNVRLKSNGIIADGLLERLGAADLGGIDISLYGATATSHDAITTRRGSFADTLRTINRLRELEVPTHINFVVSRYSVHEVEAMEALACELGTSSVITFDITRRYDGTGGSLDLKVGSQQLTELYSGPLRDLLSAPDFSQERSVQCGCALASCAVSRLGEVYPCIGAPIPSGNIREKPFSEIWKNSPELNAIRDLKLQDFKACEPCPLRAHCSRSSGNVYVTTGDYTGPEEWACMDAQARKDAYERVSSLAAP
jgi:radical SAM protein with 4Fe4S-binding SPASM domain